MKILQKIYILCALSAAMQPLVIVSVTRHEVEPCMLKDDAICSGLKMGITNNTPNMVSGRIYYSSEKFSEEKFEIDPGAKITLCSCTVNSRSSEGVQMLAKAVGLGGGIAWQVGTEKIGAGKYANEISGTQWANFIGGSPIVFKKIQFDYTRPVGNNPYAIIKKPLTKTTTYEHVFGDGSQDMELVLTDVNSGNLQLEGTVHYSSAQIGSFFSTNGLWKWGSTTDK